MGRRVTGEKAEGFFCVTKLPNDGMCAAAAGKYRENRQELMQDILEAFDEIFDHTEQWKSLGPLPAVVLTPHFKRKRSEST